MPAPKTAEENSPEKPPRKKRRWPKILGVLFLLLIAALLLINGPISRWFLDKTLTEQLAEKGMAGSTSISGQLWSGYALENVSFTGSGAWKELKADRLSLRYRLGEWFSNKVNLLDTLEAQGVRLVISPEPKEDEQEESDWRSIFDSLRSSQPFVIPGKIDISDITVILLDEEKGDRTISLENFTHEPGSQDFIIKQLSPGKLLPTPPPAQDLTITWEKESLTIDQFAVTPGLKVKDTSVIYPAAGTIAASTSILVEETPIAIDADETGKVRVSLGDSNLDLASLVTALSLEQAVTGALSELEIDVLNLLEEPSHWQGEIKLASKDLTWKERPVPDVTFGGNLDAGNITTHLTVAEKAADLKIKSRNPVEMTKDGWRDLPLDIDFQIPSLADVYRLVEAYRGPDKKPLSDRIPIGTLIANGTITTGSDEVLKDIKFDWTGTKLSMSERPLPDLKGAFVFQDKRLETSLNRTEDPEGEIFDLTAAVDLEKKIYTATATLDLKKSDWFGDLLIPAESEWRPTGPLIANWKGMGVLERKTHAGKYEIETLTLNTPDKTQTNANAKGSYQWPGEIDLENIAVRNGTLQLSGGVNWTKKKTTFKQLALEDGQGKLASVSGSGPGGPTLQDLIEAETPFDLAFKAETLRLQRLRDLLPIPLPEGYQATLDGDLQLTGTPEKPNLDGSLKASEIKIPTEGIPTLGVTLNLTTIADTLQASGEISEAEGKLATLRGNIPVDVKRWANDPEEIKKLPLSAAVLIKEFPLSRLKIVNEKLADAEGLADIDLELSGTVAEPNYQGSAVIQLDRYPLPNTPFREITDTTFRAKFDREKVILEPSKTVIAGGSITLSGEAGLAADARNLDFTVNADNALLYRDDLLISRTTGQIKLQGPFETARLSGQLGIVESLVYKDIEIIPVGRTNRSNVDAPELPSFSTKKKGLTLDLPEPFANWPVDLKIRTQDPVLVRGNLATGEATGGINITGTLSKPRPEGIVKLKDVVALLPFSTLEVKSGTIRMRPDAPLNPVLEIRGTSAVNSYNLNIYVFGTVSNPQYNLSSNPPLPESEILSLLATGSTTGDLEDPALARMRLFQLLLDETRRKANSADAGPVLKGLRQPLNAVKDLNLRVGENDPFSGRQFNSASLEINDKWAGVVEFDNEGNTRGLLRYSIRFK